MKISAQNIFVIGSNMPFSAKNDDEIIYSFKIATEEWETIKNDKNSNFTMLCCNSSAILKKSRLGTKFFSHKPKVNCNVNNPESIEHQFCKYLIAKTLHELGWNVQTEKRGNTPDGKVWIADIYAEKKDQKFIIEIQWSPQSVDETIVRHDLYKEAGIKSLWFVRIPRISHKTTYELNELIDGYNKKANVLFLKKELDNSFTIHGVKSLKYFEETKFEDSIFQHFELSSFLKKTFHEKKVKKVFADKLEKEIGIYFYGIKCWNCSHPTNIVAGLEVFATIGLQKWHLNEIPIYTAENATIFENEELLFAINSHSNNLKFGKIKYRSSMTAKGTYISNGCIKCDALLGNHFISHEVYKYKLNTFSIGPLNNYGLFKDFCIDENHWLYFE
ncbi:TPA: hypothetical protein MW242_003090 [Acinetobacter baumannii]|nr:hypothetical protein [Acinetobacter baumannii]